MRIPHFSHVIAVLALAAAPCAAAQARGDWTLGLGVHTVDPKSDNGRLAGGTLPVRVGDATRPSATIEYFVRDGLGIEVIAALPFEHDIRIEGLGRVGSTRQLPPTVSLQAHFNRDGRVSPFVGAGVNYTSFFHERTTGALAGGRLALDDSWGPAAHVGIDIALGERGALRLDARWIDIDTRVELDGTRIGSVHVDPLVWGAAYVARF